MDIIENGLISLLPPSTALTVVGILLTLAIGYLLGGLNFGVIISSLRYHDDVRSHGSGNAGATNMLRTYGKSAAILTFVGDALKAVVAIVLGTLLIGQVHYAPYCAGFAAILGHVYPCWYRFKGGKGVVVSAVTILMIDPLVFAILLAIFVIIVAFTKYVSLGSIIGMLVFPLMMYNLYGPGLHVVLAMIIGLFVVFCHRTNLVRLFNHTESKISLGHKKEKKAEKGSDNADDATDRKGNGSGK